MNPRLSAQILVTLSIVYGVTVGLLGWTDAAATETVAVVGALVIGGLWAIRGVFLRRGTS